MTDVQTTSFWRGRLPHWEVAGASYFVTVRLAGCLPQTVRRALGLIMEGADEHDHGEQARKYFAKLDQWLDHHVEKDFVTRDGVADMLLRAFAEYEARGIWQVEACVLMPNHVHWLFTPGSRSMTRAVRAFKRYTGREANRLLARQGRRFWETEWFDHWVRSPQESDRIAAYIRRNPVRASLVARPQDWPYVR